MGIFFFNSGLCCAIYCFISHDWHTVRLGVGLVGKMMVTGAYYIVQQYSSEIFPTVVRGQGLALCEIAGGIAIFLTPAITHMHKISHILPVLILGLCSLLGALATFFLPETAGRALPQTLKDGQEFGAEQSRWDFVWIRVERVTTAELQQSSEKAKDALVDQMLAVRKRRSTFNSVCI